MIFDGGTRYFSLWGRNFQNPAQIPPAETDFGSYGGKNRFLRDLASGFRCIMINQLDFKNLTHFRHAPRRMQVIHLHKFSQASHIGCCLCPIEDTDAIGLLLHHQRHQYGPAAMPPWYAREPLPVFVFERKKKMEIGDIGSCMCLSEMTKISPNGIFGI